MLDTDVDALLHVLVADLLVDDDAHRGAGNVVDDSSLAVVNLVGHALLHGTVGLDVDNVSNSVGFHVCSQVDHALSAQRLSAWFAQFSPRSPLSPSPYLLAMLAAERIARARAETSRGTHCSGLLRDDLSAGGVLVECGVEIGAVLSLSCFRHGAVRSRKCQAPRSAAPAKMDFLCVPRPGSGRNFLRTVTPSALQKTAYISHRHRDHLVDCASPSQSWRHDPTPRPTRSRVDVSDSSMVAQSALQNAEDKD